MEREKTIKISPVLHAELLKYSKENNLKLNKWIESLIRVGFEKEKEKK
jgi:hypothetical protein